MKRKIQSGTAIFLIASLLIAGGIMISSMNAAQQVVTAEEVATGDQAMEPTNPMPCAPCPQNIKEEAKKITVNAQGTVTIAPDVAYIRLSITEQMPTAKEASDAVNLKMQEVFNVMEEMGIAKKDMKTLNFNLYPQYDYQNSPPNLYAYQADNRVEIKVRDMAKVGELLAAALDAGANSVDNVSYDLTDKTDAYNKALELAVQSAQNKSQVMAEAAGVQVDPVPRVLGERRVESYGIYNDYMPAAETQVAYEMEGSMDAVSVTLAENQIVITAYVEAAYDIVP